CNGEFVVFLDADDVLYPNAVNVNIGLLLENPSWAFVSGGHDKVDEWLFPLPGQEERVMVTGDHYQALLRGNYIGMHAAVMYRRHLLDEFEFDTSLQACEDYDLYLRIARQYPVGCHAQKLAAYRHHGANMSARYYRMLTQVLKVHRRQLAHLQDEEARAAWREGARTWKRYYVSRMHQELMLAINTGERWPSLAELNALAGVAPGPCVHYVLRKAGHDVRSFLKGHLPDYALRWLHRAGLYTRYTPPPGKIQAGDFNRVTPFSADFGFDRGGAIDRYYIEKFLEENARHIRGRVLEIGDNAYTIRFGGGRISRSDVLHVDGRNSRATYIGDLADVPQVPSGAFDCIIFTQTLHLIYDFKDALRTCYRILKPGGCLLLTVPGISRIDQGEWRDHWLWSFTDTSVKRLMRETFNGSAVTVNTYGNVYVAAAFLYGMGLPEFRKECLLHKDPGFQVIISAAAVKA
ncbi:MAG TPA: methyltransferase domain-containing protein, partial [Chryseosolibacter sp.]